MNSHPLADAWSAPLQPRFTAVRYLVGVDGGGTGTRVRLSDVHGQLLGQGWAGPSALGQGIAQAWRHIQTAVQEAAAKAGIERLPLAEAAIGLGLSGAGVTAQAQAFIAQQPGYAHIELANDGTTSVIGAHAGRPGGVIAAGTGTVLSLIHI